jgi:glycosyltransferase involved in cell wall biosynthesis
MRILWLKTELLHPVDKGGKIRTYQMLRELKKDHHVTYLCLDDGTAESGALEKAHEYAHEVITVPHSTSAKFTSRFYVELIRNLRSDLPYALEKYLSPDLRERITSMAGSGDFDLLICDFLAPAVNVPPNLPIKTLLFQHNVEAMIWQRHFEVAENPIKRAYFRFQWQRMRRYEGESCRRFDWVVAVSEEDAETMKRDYGLENISHVPTGVDTDYFEYDESRETSGHDIVFTGSMDWLPNEDGIQWFVSEIFPKVQKEIPGATLTVVGRNPSAALRALSTSSDSIAITGRVPDVRPFMTRASVYVVPIRIGGGTRLKIYEAMAMGLPVVSTTVGAEGLGVEDGADILLRDDPYALSDAIVKLLRDRALAGRLGKEAAMRVQKHNSWKSVTADFARSCQLALESGAKSGVGARA